MIVLDTNVVSETMRSQPDSRVLGWLDSQMAETLFVTAISLAELLQGAAFLPDGRRKDELRDALSHSAATLFAQRILPFDVPAAHAFAEITSRARKEGRAIAMADALIAAIAASRRMIMATRDVSPFEAAGLRVVNPWRG